ncbi:MAG: bifunctional 5,10-methylene-tetrahydrofolate dehydrogenase/5,10-methylene-tetrahydrofolate cyclohydrolase [Flammeovirgaceae bacterium]|nr:bifunctional 5,10-methylene-tetrahydrofolate dehydrogenase/5,10-methylene-tetrahydrofolate cyclohydrolase [Flammeovirgaceae bacterium]
MNKILDGKKTSQRIKEEIKIKVDKLILEDKRPPHLAAILVGEDGASLTYVTNKVLSCKQVGFKSSLIRLPESISEKDLLMEIQKLNKNKEIDGFIVQLPLPNHINDEKVLLTVRADKDVDGFHPENFGRMALNMESFIPATPFGIVELLERYNIDLNGKSAVIIGRSNIVGRPISILLSRKAKIGNSTVTVVHSRTKNLEFYTKNADIIVSALGVPGFLKGNMVKDGVIIVDVGITRVKDSSKQKGYSIKGDVDFDSVYEKASFITPVPGGVGPMTIASLLINTLKAYNKNIA